MKFPHELSKERLSLLSEEDRKIYDMEHSGLYSLEPKFIPVENVIDEDVKIRRQMDLFLFESQFDELFDKELIEVVGEEEYMNIKKNLFEFIENDPEMQEELFEAPGHAADWWLPNGMKIGWLGKLAAGLLTGLLGIAAWLFMKGKDRLAMKKLKQYMNKLVELIDMGVNKKRPWYSFLMLSKKKRQNTGDYNKACFRTIQETAERNMACLYTLCVHNLGFFNPGITDFRGITSGMLPEEGSGLWNFSRVIADNVSTLSDYDKKLEKSLFLPIMPDLKRYNNLKLPALPTNYTMLMCNIEYPAKADKNPNGSLFMKPTLEILLAKAEDLGLTYFGDSDNLNIDHIIHWKDDEQTPAQQQENASFNYALKNPYIQMLLEADEENKTDQNTGAGRDSNFDPNGGIITGDIDNEIIGGELETHTEGKKTTAVKIFGGVITEAIDGYCRSSVPVILKLVKAICGENASRDSSSLEKIIPQLIAGAEGKMSDFMEELEEVLKTVLKSNRDKKAKELDDKLELQETILRLQNYLDSPDYDNKFKELILKVKFNNDETRYKKWRKEIYDHIKDGKKRGQLDKFIKDTIGVNIDSIFNKLAPTDDEPLPIWVFESLLPLENHRLYEDEHHLDSNIGAKGDAVLDTLEKGLDTNYNDIRNLLSQRMSESVSSDPSKWYIITSSRDRMNKLKEAADKEINAKIELICRLAGEGKTDIGDKFKSAISKHPMRAESLKRIWAMYSDDLQDRIETRIRSITGDNGNSNILTTIKQFLINVYPNLMATMLYYKELFYLIDLYTRKNPLSVEIKQKEVEDSKEAKLKELQSGLNLQLLDNELKDNES